MLGREPPGRGRIFLYNESVRQGCRTQRFDRKYGLHLYGMPSYVAAGRLVRQFFSFRKERGKTGLRFTKITVHTDRNVHSRAISLQNAFVSGHRVTRNKPSQKIKKNT